MNKGDLILSTGNINLYNIGENFFMYKKEEDKEVLITDTTMVQEYEKQIGDRPYGRSLVIGLGLGIPSSIILRNPEVHALVSIEMDPDIIALQSEVNAIVDGRHSVILNRVEHFLSMTAQVFDYVYFDFYNEIDKNVIKDINTIVPFARERLRDPEKGIIHGWYNRNTTTDMTNQLLEAYGVDKPWW